MLRLQGVWVILIVATLWACTTIRVTSDFDPSADFSGLRTYAWIPGPQERTGDPRIDNPLLDSRIRETVDRQLAAQGYQKQRSGRPDFWIGYHAAIKSKMSIDVINDYYHYPRGWGWGYGAAYAPSGATTYVHEYEEGTLILDVVNPQTSELIWRGSADAEVNRRAKPEERQKKLGKAVQKILSRFPPD